MKAAFQRSVDVMSASKTKIQNPKVEGGRRGEGAERENREERGEAGKGGGHLAGMQAATFSFGLVRPFAFASPPLLLTSASLLPSEKPGT